MKKHLFYLLLPIVFVNQLSAQPSGRPFFAGRKADAETRYGQCGQWVLRVALIAGFFGTKA